MKLEEGKKYIFATDLDGTFLADFISSIHIDSYEMIEAIKEGGHHFVISTGRSWMWTKMYYDQIGASDATIQFAGAHIHHPEADKDFIEFKAYISENVIKELVDKIDMWSFAHMVQAVGRNSSATWSKGDDLSKIFFNSYEYIISWENDKADFDELVKKIESIIGEGYIYRGWNEHNEKPYQQLIISPQGTSKAEALKEIAKYYGVDREQVIYFGDNANDIEALEWAGYSYVPANAVPKAKEAAREILELNCNQGAVPKKILELLGKR